jgi:hypothetical protein
MYLFKTIDISLHGDTYSFRVSFSLDRIIVVIKCVAPPAAFSLSSAVAVFTKVVYI